MHFDFDCAFNLTKLFWPPLYYRKLFGPPLLVTQNFFGPPSILPSSPHQSIYERSLSDGEDLWSPHPMRATPGSEGPLLAVQLVPRGLFGRPSRITYLLYLGWQPPQANFAEVVQIAEFFAFVCAGTVVLVEPCLKRLIGFTNVWFTINWCYTS